ncbi:uncharacterized protein LOC114973034 [Acropora millepora]|uniref:uncharacterized protein LOC114973034 n=1 Tax=Acropora millepora TaxID=45264 RepID=UPI001CF4D46D|nr:uncharacterized protein LOC114973034 [Acropora millepora]
MLNSFWEKFGQRDIMPPVELVRDPERYYELLTCQSTQVKNILQFVNDECVQVYYTHGEGFISGSDNMNVVIAAFTTEHARLKLYSVLERLQTRFLYFDTDSVIFKREPPNWMPALGDYPGELTNELDDDYITTFVSSGPKNYAYQTRNGKTTCKVRGFTLKYRRLQKLNFANHAVAINSPYSSRIHISSNEMLKQKQYKLST